MKAKKLFETRLVCVGTVRYQGSSELFELTGLGIRLRVALPSQAFITWATRPLLKVSLV